METVELKPCPFCGSKDIYRVENYYSCKVTFACSNCDAFVGWKENTEEARKAWNTRFNEEEE